MMYALVLFVWLILGSLVVWWLIANSFSILSNAFLFRGVADKSVKLVFQITTRACPPTVERAIESIISAAASLDYRDYFIWVVTDNPSPCVLPNANMHVLAVPPQFKCNAKFKGRALEFARRKRIEHSYDGWVFFMDEENWVTQQTISAITNYAAHSKRQLASGPLAFASGGSLLSWLADAPRTAECRISHLGHRFGWWPPHGENLLMHSRVEVDVGWDRETILEDARFAASARAQGYRIGWHGGELYTTSPTCVSDLLVQRRRWYGGWLEFVLADNVNRGRKALMLYWLICSLAGALLVPSVVASMIINPALRPMALEFGLPILGCISICYCSGCRGTVWQRLMALMLGPLLLTIEGLAAWWSVIDRPRHFDVITKA